jgi:hypothetical protein
MSQGQPYECAVCDLSYKYKPSAAIRDVEQLKVKFKANQRGIIWGTWHHLTKAKVDIRLKAVLEQPAKAARGSGGLGGTSPLV